jgi:hypothetical protein
VAIDPHPSSATHAAADLLPSKPPRMSGIWREANFPFWRDPDLNS